MERRSHALRIHHVANVLGIGVMDLYTRRILGFGIEAGIVDGMGPCRMFKQAIRRAGLPKYISVPITIRCIDFINGKPT